MRLTVYLQCTALPGHSLLCPQFAQVPWCHSKKWRSGLLTQRSHCTDPYNQDLPTSIGDCPKTNRSKKIISGSGNKHRGLPPPFRNIRCFQNSIFKQLVQKIVVSFYILPYVELQNRTTKVFIVPSWQWEERNRSIWSQYTVTYNTTDASFLFSYERSSDEVIVSYCAEYSFHFPQKILTRSLNGCFSGISHSSLIVMYLKEQFHWLPSMQALLVGIPKSTDTHDSCTHLSKSVNRLTLKVCCLSSL